MTTLLRQDLDHVLQHTQALWPQLRGQHLLITGGTGFFGRWLVETFLWAAENLSLQARITVLTRHPERFQAACPHLARSPAVRLLTGDIRTFSALPDDVTAVIHGAAHPDTPAAPPQKLDLWNTLVQGTQHLLDLACAGSVEKLLFVSSGAVYGRQPVGVARLAEDYSGAPDPSALGSTYGAGKRAGEMLCTLYGSTGSMQIKIARCFTFVGPHLPLDAHFAAGNFIRDGLANRPIRITGDGATVRSYLYAADLCIWLWTILLRGQSLRPYNVGSAEAVTILSLAAAVAGAFAPRPAVQIAPPAGRAAPPSVYVPDVRRAETELDLRQIIPLHEAIERTIRWHHQSQAVAQ